MSIGTANASSITSQHAEQSGSIVSPVQQYTVSVYYDNGANGITIRDEENNVLISNWSSLPYTFDEGSYLKISIEPYPVFFIKEILVNGVSVGTYEEEDNVCEYVIENLTENMDIQFVDYPTAEVRTIKYHVVGRGTVKLYKNNTLVDGDRGTVFDCGDQLKLVFEPDDGCVLSSLTGFDYDPDFGPDFTSAVKNNTYTSIAFDGYEYEGFVRNYVAVFDGPSIALSESNFPDANFRAYISSLTGVEEGGSLTDEILKSVESIDVQSKSITNLQGIEFFSEMGYLNCSDNQLENIDLSKNAKLYTFICDNNQLTSIDLSNNVGILQLICNDNQLTSIDVSNITYLRGLNCINNQLMYLDLSNCTMGYGHSLFVSPQTVSLVASSFNPNQYIVRVPTGFDITRVSEFKVDGIDTTPTVMSGELFGVLRFTASSVPQIITYKYDTGNSAVGTLDFTINNSAFEDNSVLLNETNFPDANFRAYITSITGVAEGGTLNNEVLQSVTSIDVNNINITSLKGIEYFTALTTLYCYHNHLTSLNVSNNIVLEHLSCNNNQLTSLDVSNNTALISLTCSSNLLTELDVSNNTRLESLLFNDNKLTSIDVSKNTALTYFDCAANDLTSLDISNNTALTQFYCYSNHLMDLDASGCAILNANRTSITSQSISLTAMSIGSNKYCINVPSGFDISKVSAFTVDGVSSTPSFINGTLVFTATSSPQTITYQYDSGNSVAGLMDVTVNITSVEEPNYDNTIYMDDMEVLSGTEAVLSVKMKNTVVAEGFEFNLYLPEGVTVVTDEDGFPDVTLSTERTNSRKTNSFDAILREDGSLRVLGASTNGSTISGNDGEIVQVKVAIADDMVEGEYIACVKDIAISDENSVSYTSAMTTSTIKVNAYLVGDANKDRTVDVADFIAVAHHLLENTPANFHSKAADANQDEKLDVADLTAIAHLILYGTISKPTNASPAKQFMPMVVRGSNESTEENYIYIEPVSVQGNSQVTLSIKMKNTVEAEGFGFDLYLPEGMTFATDADGFIEASLSTERTNSNKTNSFDAVIRSDGALRVLAASTNGSSISGNDGEIAVVTVNVASGMEAGEYPLIMKEIAISDVDAVSHRTILQESTITILNNGITTSIDSVDDVDDNAEWYTLDGKKLNGKPKAKGVYIMNGKKVRVK